MHITQKSFRLFCPWRHWILQYPHVAVPYTRIPGYLKIYFLYTKIQWQQKIISISDTSRIWCMCIYITHLNIVLYVSNGINDYKLTFIQFLYPFSLLFCYFCWKFTLFWSWSMQLMMHLTTSMKLGLILIVYSGIDSKLYTMFIWCSIFMLCT